MSQAQTTLSKAFLADWVAEQNKEALLADGFEEAVIGLAERCSQPTLVVYDAQKCIEILMKRERMTQEAAEEFFEYNVAGSWRGEGTPLFLWKIPL